MTLASGPTVSPAYIGVGYIIGPELAALNFAGGVLAWGFLVPLLIFFLGPQLQTFLPAGATDASWVDLINAVWRYIVRPIAVGGMMTGAAYTLFRMRKGLFDGLKRAVSDLRVTATAAGKPPHRTVHELENRVRPDRGDVRVHDRALHLSCRIRCWADSWRRW